MLATLLAIIVAVILFVYGSADQLEGMHLILSVTLMGVATLFVLAISMIMTSIWAPLQRVGQKISGHIVEIVCNDRWLSLCRAWILLFALVTFFLSIGILYFPKGVIYGALLVWLVLLGLACDALHRVLWHTMEYWDPFRVAAILAKKAIRSVAEDKISEMYHWVDGVAEVGLQAIPRYQISLCNYACSELEHVTKVYLQAVKSISHPIEDVNKVNYTVYFILQRFEMLNDKASKEKLELICSQIVKVIGKIAIESAKFDMSLPPYPLRFMGNLANEAQKKGLKNIGTTAASMLTEVAKAILTEIDVTSLELQDTFTTLIAQLSAVTNEMYRQNKEINLDLLTRPFKDIKLLFQSEKMALHPDTAAIVQRIDFALVEYDMLAAALRAVPPISLEQPPQKQ